MGNLNYTVSGDIASFRTPSKVPIESLKFHFLPKQVAGTPSPENPIPIEGWMGLNGKRTGKNIGHIVGYSTASMNSPTASRFLTNLYGTTINTLNFISPDTPLVITQEQTSSWDSSNPISYKNGYFCVGFDNLVFEQSYDFSFKITDIISNPLNVSLDTVRVNTPGGSYKPPSEIKNSNILIYKNIKWTQYTAHPEGLNRCTLEFRNCGMSFTISEIMVTPANKSDGVFEPYSGSTIPITFPIDDENKFNATVKQGNIASNGKEIAVSNDRLITNGFMYLPAGMYTLSSQQNYPCAIYVYSDQDEDSYIIAESLTSWNNSPLTFILTVGRYIRLKWKNDEGTTILPSDLTNIQIKLCTFYGGGYVDPIAGEIVCSWRKFKLKEYEWVYKSGNHRFQMQLSSYEKANAPSAGWTNFAISDSYKQSNYAGYMDLMIAGYGNNMIYIRDDRYANETDFVEAMGEIEIAYELVNPIHIPITQQDIQVFLDHNNFWSDANDVTEVTYVVTESKDILETRKKAIACDYAHHKKINWNQWVHDGNFTNINLWYVNKNYGSISASDNIMRWTCTEQPTQYYHTGFMRDTIHSAAIPWNHRIIIRAVVRCSIATRFNLYGLVGSGGNTHTYFYRNDIPANEWTELIGFIRDRPETPPAGVDDLTIIRFKPCISGTNSQISTVTVGTTFDVKEFVAYDLTQMFGLGNEPSTIEEFKHICEINGIDLTIYQPYDTGSDRWLIIP